MECITLSDSQDDEELMFRAMFNTAFIRSNVVDAGGGGAGEGEDASLKRSLDLASVAGRTDPTELHVSVETTAQSKIIPPSNQDSCGGCCHGWPVALARYHSAPVSSVGITALLQDHAEFSANEGTLESPPPPPPPPSPSNVSIAQSSPKSIPPPPPPPKHGGTITDVAAKGVPPPPAPLLNASSKHGGTSFSTTN